MRNGKNIAVAAAVMILTMCAFAAGHYSYAHSAQNAAIKRILFESDSGVAKADLLEQTNELTDDSENQIAKLGVELKTQSAKLKTHKITMKCVETNMPIAASNFRYPMELKCEGEGLESEQ